MVSDSSKSACDDASPRRGILSVAFHTMFAHDFFAVFFLGPKSTNATAQKTAHTNNAISQKRSLLFFSSSADPYVPRSFSLSRSSSSPHHALSALLHAFNTHSLLYVSALTTINKDHNHHQHDVVDREPRGR